MAETQSVVDAEREAPAVADALTLPNTAPASASTVPEAEKVQVVVFWVEQVKLTLRS